MALISVGVVSVAIFSWAAYCNVLETEEAHTVGNGSFRREVEAEAASLNSNPAVKLPISGTAFYPISSLSMPHG
jgi:hypothetical protein